jgi:hypothetical protein
MHIVLISNPIGFSNFAYIKQECIFQSITFALNFWFRQNNNHLLGYNIRFLCFYTILFAMIKLSMIWGHRKLQFPCPRKYFASLKNNDVPVVRITNPSSDYNILSLLFFISSFASTYRKCSPSVFFLSSPNLQIKFNFEKKQ